MSITKILFSSCSSNTVPKHQTPTASFQNSTIKGFLLSSLAPLTLAMTLSSPIATLAIPSPSSQPSLLPSTTPYSQSQNLQLGLENGKIRPCPSTNPGCLSTNPKSSSFGFPWVIPENSSESAVQKLRDAILKTQRNAEIKVDEKTPNGHYLQAEVDGGFGRDVMEFLVKADVVAYRSMATKVTYIYPFTTAFGDSKGQKERMSRIMEDLGWYAPNFESMD
ncbi:thylakoid lumenal 17.9 kDa protein, chloroplastic [Phoenix dactylifera]|uniref:Thylakoid lumenal 17.9 kDa protein, chloroplastic n=1 Tax=Phoenix dactylifera TaxID=42345 RepID=A0A8B7BIV6_PHODC|nr:thylakoid lumenal 17.9 kDa protein, chloroplastic [Phoenix dactylifera]